MATRVSAEPRQYRGIVVGAGGVARGAHLPAYQSHAAVRDRLHIVGVMDAAPVAPLADLPLVDRDGVDALGPIDFIDICTPTATHLELALWGLSRGYHVLCEKPVATTRREADTLAAAAARARRVVMACHQYRFNPVWRQVIEWLSDGAIGRWHLAEWTVHRPAADPGALRDAVPWRGRSAKSLGGVLLDHGTHLIYQLLDIAGTPRAVSAWTGHLRHTAYDVEDTATIQLEYPGRLATMLLTWAGAGRENRVRFVGESGAIDWNGPELVLQRGAQVERRDVAAATSKAAYHEWFAELFASFARAMDDGVRAEAIADIRKVATVLELAYTAARTGCKQRFPEDA
jgi:predicted dehydrogenase